MYCIAPSGKDIATARRENVAGCLPRTDNGNCLWIQPLHSALNFKDNAKFVLTNSVSDARNSEPEFRKRLHQCEIASL